MKINESVGQYAEIHASREDYGCSGAQFLPHVKFAKLELGALSVLEYGCGRSGLHSYFDASWVRYDPAIPEVAQKPSGKFDLVLNTDVMEHIPVESEDEVLKDMASYSSRVLFNISTRLADQILPNGENAHCNLKEPKAWLEIIRKYFPEARIVYRDRLERDCMIITWPSEMPYIYAALTLRNRRYSWWRLLRVRLKPIKEMWRH